MKRIAVKAESVEIDSLVPYPGNARRGNIEAIADSLRTHGQYRPVVAHTQSRQILAGNHTVEAARTLGWAKIAVTWFDGTDEQARKVVLADNRTSDLAMYNDEALLRLLEELPALDGTGFDVSDLDRLDGLYSSNGSGSSEKQTPEQTTGVVIRAGDFRTKVDADVFAAWEAPLTAGDQPKSKITAEIRRRLGVPDSPKASKKATKARQKPQASEPYVSMSTVSVEPVDSLLPYPGNPREGDVGAIAESLRVLGQYRPIVVNRTDRTILVGNHTFAAACAMGWDAIAVVWVNVDEEQARKIVLADNRTSDLASYDEAALAALLKSCWDLDGTGYDPDDLDDIVRGGSAKNAASPGSRAKFEVGQYRFTVPGDLYDTWAAELPTGAEIEEVLHRLDLPLDAITE